MSALPDLRLQATPEVKSKAKQPAKAPEPSKNGASSFAEVYAKERQAKPGERAGSTDKTSQEQKSAPSAGEPDAASTAAEQPAVAAPAIPCRRRRALQKSSIRCWQWRWAVSRRR